MSHGHKTNTLYGKYASILICVFLAATTLAVYWPMHNYEFINYDDGTYIFENSHVKAGLNRESIEWAFTTSAACNWHPVTWLSHMLDVEFFGLDAGAHHLVNLFFHIANSLLLFLLLRYMTSALWPAAFVAALFALHPLHIESVAWVSERKDVLSTLFAFLTMLAWVRYIKCHKVFWYICALLLFAAGLMAKPMLVTLPFILLLLDYWPFERLRFSAGKLNIDNRKAKQAWGLIVEKIPFFALSAASSVVTFVAQRTGGAVVTIEDFSAKVRVLNAAISFIEYLTKMFWPAKLSVFYPHPGNDVSVLKAVICAVLLIVLSALFFYFGRRKKYLAVGWLWYLGTLIPVIGLVQVGAQAMADRYTYIPLTGIFIMLVWTVAELAASGKDKKLVIAAAAAAIAGLIIITRIQLAYWQNSLILFGRSVEVTEKNHVMNNNLGVAYSRLGRYQEAIQFCERALSIRPNDAEAYNNLGNAQMRLGRYQEAIESFNKAIKIKADLAAAYSNLSIAYMALGRYEESLEFCKKAIEIKPDYADAHYNFGNASLALGHYGEAIESYKQAVKFDPDDADTHYNLGLVYSMTGERDLALKEYEILKTLNAERANKLLNLLNSEKKF